MYWRPNTHIPLYKNKKCLQWTSFLVKVSEKGEACDVDLYSLCHQHCQVSSQNVCWLHFVPFIYTTIYHPGPGLFIFSRRSWQDRPNWSHWLLSFSAESYPACHYQISFPKTLLSWCNYLPRDLLTVRHWKKPPGPTFHSHSFLSTLSNKLP